LAVFGPGRRSLGLANEPALGERGRESSRGHPVRAGDQADAARREHAGQQAGDHGNEAGLVDHVGTQDDRMLLVGQVAPIELACRKPRGIKPIFGRTPDNEIQGSRVVVGELHAQASLNGNQAGQPESAADFQRLRGV
jgi:hypothetical protein